MLGYRLRGTSLPGALAEIVDSQGPGSGFSRANRRLAAAATGLAAGAPGGPGSHFLDRHVEPLEVLAVEPFDGLAGRGFAGHIDLAPATALVDGDGGDGAEELEEHAEVVFGGVGS